MEQFMLPVGIIETTVMIRAKGIAFQAIKYGLH
jgi:hypothetical protein